MLSQNFDCVLIGHFKPDYESNDVTVYKTGVPSVRVLFSKAVGGPSSTVS